MAKHVWGDSETQFFYSLDPDVILDSVDRLGFRTTGRCLAMNSMENRVYEIEIEVNEKDVKSPSDHFVVGKYYRPGRWSKEQILDEHRFMLELKDHEIPVVAPLEICGETLFKLPEHNLWYALFPKRGGRTAAELTDEQLMVLGRTLGRLHNIGASQKAKYRLHITPESFGTQNLNYLLNAKVIPPHLEMSFEKIGRDVIELMAPLFKNVTTHRIHGDCHRGNILSRDESLFLIDFDDMLVGPAIQDIWLAVPSMDEYGVRERNMLLEGYEEMRSFDYSTLKLIEPLRTLRYIHFAAWIAKRWEDPAFKTAFPHFGDGHYFEILLNDLRIQLAKIQEQGTEQVTWYS